jgi:hypothetical protein
MGVDAAAVILESSIHGASRLEILRKTRLDAQTIDEHIKLLSTRKLIAAAAMTGSKNKVNPVEKTHIFKTTSRGNIFLQMYKAVEATYLAALAEKSG